MSKETMQCSNEALCSDIKDKLQVNSVDRHRNDYTNVSLDNGRFVNITILDVDQACIVHTNIVKN